MRKAPKMLLALSLVLPALLSPLAASAHSLETMDALRTRRQTRESFETRESRSELLSPASNDALDAMRTRRQERQPLVFEAPATVDVEAFENTRLNETITTRQAAEEAGIESHIEDWTDEEMAAFDELVNANFSAFFDLLDTPEFELSFAIIHYYWLSLDFGVDFLEVVLGLSLDDFTDEDIHALEELIGTFFELDAGFGAIIEAVFEDGMSFEEASTLMMENTEGFLALIPLFEAQLSGVIPSPEAPENPWTEEEMAVFNELAMANEEAFWTVDELIGFAFRVVNMDPADAEERFGFDADDIASFETMIEEFFAADELFWDVMIGMYEGTLSFEEASAMVIESTERFVTLITALEEIISEFKVEPWTDAEFDAFGMLLDENDAAFDAIIVPIITVSLFDLELTEEEQIAFDHIIASFEALDILFFDVLTDAFMGIISFEEAVAGVTESTEGFQTLLAELEALFDVQPWTDEEVEIFLEALLASEEILWGLFADMDFAFILLFYHEIGQNSDLDLIYILFGFSLTDENAEALEQIIVESWELDDNFFLLVMLLFSDTRIVTLEQALEFNAANTDAMLELISRFLEIVDGHLDPPPPLPPGTGIIPEEDALRELMFEIGLLQLEESEFTPESWSLFIDAIDAATEVLDNIPDHDVEAIVRAHENLQEAFDGLETISGEEPTPPTRPNFPEITLPEIVIPEITIPGIPTLPFSIGLKTL